MEANVLRALRYAEYVHHLALDLVIGDELLNMRLKAARRKRAALAKKFNALMIAWEDLTEEERLDLIWAAEPIPLSKVAEWWDRPVSHAKPIVERINNNLEEIHRITSMKLQWTQGRRPGHDQSGAIGAKPTPLIPLIAFAKALKAFWESATGSSFGQQFDEDKKWVARSAASNFILAATPYLRAGYTATHVKQAMIQIQKEGWTTEDDDFRKEVREISNLTKKSTPASR
jgi:hypothetical protein